MSDSNFPQSNPASGLVSNTTEAIAPISTPFAGPTNIAKPSVGSGQASPRAPISHHGIKGSRRVGRCKRYNCDKGIGFLIDDDLNQVPFDVKFHWTDLYSDKQFKSLAKGEVVEFTLNLTPNGYSASYVTGPGRRPVMGAEPLIIQTSRQNRNNLFKAGALPAKTYQSKWDAVLDPAIFLKSPEDPSAKEQTSPMTPANVAMLASSATPPTPATARVGVRSMKPKFPAMSEKQIATRATLTNFPVTIVSGHTGSPWSHYVSPQHISDHRQSREKASVRKTPGIATNPVFAQYEAILSSDYCGRPFITPSPFFAANAIRNAATVPVDINTTLADRRLTLQRQATMVAYHETHPAMNFGFSQPDISHAQLSKLLSPISLPASHSPAFDPVRSSASSWGHGSALRADTSAFPPALNNTFSPSSGGFKPSEPVSEVPCEKPSGRRTGAYAKPSALLRKRSLVETKLPVPGAPRVCKRVTFAEDPVQSRHEYVVQEEEPLTKPILSAEIALNRLREAALLARLSVLSQAHPDLSSEVAAWVASSEEIGGARTQENYASASVLR